MTASNHTTSLRPVWLIWLTLLPVFPPLLVCGVLGLRQWRRLPQSVLLLCGVFLSTQILAAALSPKPLLSLGTTTLRVTLVLSLIVLGAQLGQPVALRVLRWGLLAVYLTALLNGLSLQGWDLTQLRLSHPYVPPVSLGLAGALGLWLSLDVAQGEAWRSGWVWRLPLGLLGIMTVLLSGSRGPLAVALFGTLLMLIWRRMQLRQVLVFAALATLPLLGLISAGLRGGPLERLVTLDLTGRDLIWSDALSVAQAHPWAGTGTLLLGPRIAPTGVTCTWFEALEVRGLGCPPLLEEVNNVWVFAHNSAVHSLGETGLLGTAGLFLLLGGIGAAAVTRAPIIAALIFGLLIADLTDNVTLLPGPFFSVVFWLAAGGALARSPVTWSSSALWGSAFLVLTAFPIWTQFVPVSAGKQIKLPGLIAPSTWRADEPYSAAAQFTAPPGMYRAQLRACRVSCVTVATKPFTLTDSPSTWQWMIGSLPSTSQVGGTASEPYRIELRLWSGISAPWRTRSLTRTSWDVQVQP